MSPPRTQQLAHKKDKAYTIDDPGRELSPIQAASSAKQKNAALHDEHVVHDKPRLRMRKKKRSPRTARGRSAMPTTKQHHEVKIRKNISKTNLNA